MTKIVTTSLLVTEDNYYIHLLGTEDNYYIHFLHLYRHPPYYVVAFKETWYKLSSINAYLL